MKPLILASGSPRRAKILRDLGLDFEIVKTDAPEVSLPHDPEGTVTRNAVAKLQACARSLASGDDGRCILAADTIVWYDGRIYGKPRDLDEARAFLRTLSGRTHAVFTGVAYGTADRVQTACVRADVTFRALSGADIEDYVARVNPIDRAGAYDIDTCGEIVVASYTGSYENIMGLPVEPLREFLKDLSPSGEAAL